MVERRYSSRSGNRGERWELSERLGWKQPGDPARASISHSNWHPPPLDAEEPPGQAFVASMVDTPRTNIARLSSTSGIV